MVMISLLEESCLQVPDLKSALLFKVQKPVLQLR